MEAKVEEYIARLKNRANKNPTNKATRKKLNNVLLLKKQLNLVRNEVKRQRNKGIPAPTSQTPEQKKRLNNYFLKKAKEEVLVNKLYENLGKNIATTKVSEQVKTLQNIQQGIQNSRAAQSSSTTVQTPVNPYVPTMSPYPVRIGGKTRKQKRRNRSRRN